MRRHVVVRMLIDRQATDLIETSSQLIKDNNIESLDDVRSCMVNLISFSSDLRNELDKLKEFLNIHMYRHPHMLEMAEKAEDVIRTIFARYKDDPYRLHGKFKLRLDDEPLEVIICDFIAGMTDRYAFQKFKELG
jgi:dGTPase